MRPRLLSIIRSFFRKLPRACFSPLPGLRQYASEWPDATQGGASTNNTTTQKCTEHFLTHIRVDFNTTLSFPSVQPKFQHLHTTVYNMLKPERGTCE